MKNKLTRSFSAEIFSAIVLVLLLIVLINPSGFFMPSMMEMLTEGVAVVAFGFLAVFILQEQVEDEREDRNRSLAGRVAFLAGAAVLLTGIIVQLYRSMLDPWLVTALVGMIVAKVVTRMYADSHF